MVRGDDYWPFAWNITQTLDLGAKCAHQEWCQEGTENPIRDVVEHPPNLAVIARYDTI